jgi:hypothetical protein
MEYIPGQKLKDHDLDIHKNKVLRVASASWTNTW